MRLAVNTAKLLKKVPLPDEITQVHDNGVVIDTGGGTMKAGFSGDDFPRVVMPTCTGSSRGQRGEAREFFAGNDAHKRREDIDLVYPMDHGKVTDWDSIEKIWEHILGDSCLKVSSDEVASTPVLLSEPALTDRDTREKMAEIFFEKLKVPSLYVSVSPVLSLYASGRTTGAVLECGQSTAHTVPIFEGFPLYHSILQLNYGGGDMTKYMVRSLAEKGHTFHPVHETEICQFVKEKLCVIAQDPKQLTSTRDTVKHILPDGTEVTLGAERYICAESIFDPSCIGIPPSTAPKGIHSTAMDSIKKCDADITSLLYNNVVLSGGGTMFYGIQDRMFKELTAIAPSEKIKIYAATERKYATWLGGSILASLPTFQDFWVTRNDYDENHNVVHRNCF